MRTHFALTMASFLLLLVPVPVLAHDVPTELPEAPALEAPVDAGLPEPPVAEFVGHYQGVAYAVREGVVHRVDGLPVEKAAALAIAQAQRAHDLLEENAPFLERLAERERYESILERELSEAQGAVAALQAAAQALAPADASSLVDELLAEHARDAQGLESFAEALELEVQAARGHLDPVKSASADARRKADAFLQSHDVEDKKALLESLAGAVPVYGQAADRLDAVSTLAGRAASQVENTLDRLLADAEKELFSLNLLPGLPEVEDARARLAATPAGLQEEAASLREDAAFMQSVAQEPPKDGLPLAWLIGGGSGALATGAGSLWWLRRRAGLP